MAALHTTAEIHTHLAGVIVKLWYCVMLHVLLSKQFRLYCAVSDGLFPLRHPVTTFVPRQITQPTCYLTILARATSRTSLAELKARAACLTENNQSRSHQYGLHSQPDITEKPSHGKTTMSWHITWLRRNGTNQQSIFSLTRYMEMCKTFDVFWRI